MNKKMQEVILGRQGGANSDQDVDQFVEGVVEKVTPEGMFFTIPEWDDGVHLFGPAPWPRSQVVSTDLGSHSHSVSSTNLGSHDHTATSTNLGSHSHTTTAETTSSTNLGSHTHTVNSKDLGSHTHTGGSSNLGGHNHLPAEPSKGARCVVLFLGAGVDRPWVLGVW